MLRKKWGIRFLLAAVVVSAVTSAFGAYYSTYVNESLTDKKLAVVDGSIVLESNNKTSYGETIEKLRSHGDLAVNLFILATALPLLAPFYLLELGVLYWIMLNEQEKTSPSAARSKDKL